MDTLTTPGIPRVQCGNMLLIVTLMTNLCCVRLFVCKKTKIAKTKSELTCSSSKNFSGIYRDHMFACDGTLFSGSLGSTVLGNPVYDSPPPPSHGPDDAELTIAVSHY